jgi:hypothetical protein
LKEGSIVLFVLYARSPRILRQLVSKQLISVAVVIVFSFFAWLYPQTLYGQIIDKRAALNRETFWDNRDFDWYHDQIPFFECPDQDITTTYYYRWDLLTKHLTYGSPNSGYSFTEFIDRPFWSGAYGAISCPAGHQLYEARWLRSPRIANDYSRYWLRTPGAQPRNYSTWLADSMWAIHQVHPDQHFLLAHLNDLINNYRGWEERHFVPEVGLFWQTGHDDGMEFNINSRQTQDILRGAPSYRPSFNAYMWADAMAIARIAELAGQTDVAAAYRAKGESIKTKMLALMWDEKRQFFFPVLKNDEERNGHRLKALTRTYESGEFAGDPHGRELIGYVPWQFRMFEANSQFDVAWKKLMERDGFYATYGPSTVERDDPMFLLQKSCCWWSGQSWPYATTQTLKGLANHLQFGGNVLTQDDYVESLAIYARSHRKDGKPYLAEALHPDTGSFEGHDGYNHSEHYFHSGYCDLVITGLAGLVPRDDATLEIRPLASKDWSYFALVDAPYRGHLVSLVWDKVGDRYKLGPGFHVIVDGVVVKSLPALESLEIENAVPFEAAKRPENQEAVLTNFAVNNDGTFYPRLTTSYTSEQTSQAKLHDGNYWYMRHPPNRWTCEDSPNAEDWITVDFGTERQLELVKLYVLDDSGEDNVKVRAPAGIELEFWKNGSWKPVPVVTTPVAIEGHRPVSLRFEPQLVEKLRITLKHSAGSWAGLTEIEAWGLAKLPLPPLPHPKENIAYNSGASEYPKATASYHDRFGGLPRSAIDGVTNFLPTPTNRWTSYESPNAQDWLEIDFGIEKQFGRVEMAIYDDRGGVQAPTDYVIQKWESGNWKTISETSRSPAKPIGGQWNKVTFPTQKSSKLRILFTNRSPARSGLSEIMVVDLAKDP